MFYFFHGQLQLLTCFHLLYHVGLCHLLLIGQMMKEILIASNNDHKFQEISAILTHLPIKLIKPLELGLKLNPAEDGSTYYENSILKASAFYQASGIPVLADDSGLKWKPWAESRSPFTSFSPKPGATDYDRCLYLLSKLDDKPSHGWQPFIVMQSCI